MHIRPLRAQATMRSAPHLPPFRSPSGRGRGSVGANVAHSTSYAQRLMLPARQWERAADSGTEHWSPNVVWSRYVPNKKSELLIMLLCQSYLFKPCIILPALLIPSNIPASWRVIQRHVHQDAQFLRTRLVLGAYPEYPVAKEDWLGHSAAVPVHPSGFIRRTVRRLFG